MVRMFFRKRRDEEPEPRRPDVEPMVAVASSGTRVYLGLGEPSSGPLVASGWLESKEWLFWEPPLNAVRGESRYQDSLSARCGPQTDEGYCVPLEAALVREPMNPVDANAIRVQLEGDLVGYVARELAAELTPIFDAARCTTLLVPAIIRGGSSFAPTLGIHLWLARRCSEGPDFTVPAQHVETMSVRWPPAYLPGEEADEEVGPKGPVDGYFDLRGEIQRAWSDRDFAYLIDLANRSIELLDALVDGTLDQQQESRALFQGYAKDAELSAQMRESFGDRFDEIATQEPRFDIKSIPAITQGGRAMAAVGDRSGLERMWQAVARNVHLASFVEEVDALLLDEERTRRLVEYVAANPGALQKDAWRIVSAPEDEKQHVSWLVTLANEAGRLLREKRGNTYSLSRDKVDRPPRRGVGEPSPVPASAAGQPKRSRLWLPRKYPDEEWTEERFSASLERALGRKTYELEVAGELSREWT